MEGITFLVSGEVRDALSALPAHLHRPDVFAPESGANRNAEGHIVVVSDLVQ